MKKTVVPFIIITFALLAAATFFDLRIDIFLYTPDSSFGRFFAVAGIMPVNILLPFAPGFLSGSVFNPAVRLKKIWFAGCLLLTAAGIALLAVYIKSNYKDYYLSLPPGVIIAVSAVIFAAGVFSGFKLSQKHPVEAFTIAIIGVISLLASNFTVNVLKYIWGRQRFFSMTDPAAQFTPWYLPQGRPASDDFKSFPSGHSLGAAALIWLSLFPALLKKRAAFRTKITVCVALIFTLTVMLSRMVLGKHFLSDVTMGASIFLTIFFLSKYLAGKYCRRMFYDIT